MGGDIDHWKSFGYQVHYHVVKGLTFKLCQHWQTCRDHFPGVQRKIYEAVDFLARERKVVAITGDCGFMLYMQSRIREYTPLPVLMSSLVQLSMIKCIYKKDACIAVMTANGKSIEGLLDIIAAETSLNHKRTKRHSNIIGCKTAAQDKELKRVEWPSLIPICCEDIPGFEAVALGDKVDYGKVAPGMVQKMKDAVALNPRIKCVLMECTELSQFSDDIRATTGLPVYDAVTGCDTCMTAFQNNDRFGKDAWYMVDEIEEQPLDGEFSTPEEREAIDARVDKIIGVSANSDITTGICKPCRG